MLKIIYLERLTKITMGMLNSSYIPSRTEARTCFFPFYLKSK